MGSGISIEERKIDQLLKSNNPNINEIALKLPRNKEIRVKKIYHVNRQELNPVMPAEAPPVKIVKVIQPTIMHPPPLAQKAMEYQPRVLVKDPNASATIRINLGKPVRK